MMKLFELECPYLERNGFTPLCSASPARSTPGERELKAYCTTEEHHNCTTLLGYILRSGPVRSRAFRRMRLYNG